MNRSGIYDTVIRRINKKDRIVMHDLFIPEADTMPVTRKLRRLLAKFPEEWVHYPEKRVVDGVAKIFHHVTYKSSGPGRQVIRLVDNVSPEMCELIVALKTTAVGEAKAPPAPAARKTAVRRPATKKKASP